MTKQELIDEINKKIDQCKDKMEESGALDRNENSEFYRGKLLGLMESKILANTVYEDDKLIKVSYVFYLRLTDTSQVRTKYFGDIIEYTLWLRDLSIKNPEIMVTDVSYTIKEKKDNEV